jgi:hypothetical protein
MLPRGVEIDTAGADGQLFVKANPWADGENRAGCG